ncbi:hypothetical protein A5N72_19285 [Prescottella equi]|nr:hypothetical protein A6409_19020 [Prescottella equi]ORM01316.1 hypothetical protein A5N72_19285 [Prescottella equi]
MAIYQKRRTIADGTLTRLEPLRTLEIFLLDRVTMLSQTRESIERRQCGIGATWRQVHSSFRSKTYGSPMTWDSDAVTTYTLTAKHAE